MKLINTFPQKKPKKRGRKKDITKMSYKTDHFIEKGDLTSIHPAYLCRLRNILVLQLSDINYEGITLHEMLMLKALPSFTGFFDEVVLCKSFTYFDDLQLQLEQEGVSFRNRFLHKVIL